MNLYTAEQIRAWDAFTIANEPVSSINLMERAALQCTQWLLQHVGTNKRFAVFCGKGNNGGDGLAIARMLFTKGITVDVYILEFGAKGSEDFQENLARLHHLHLQPHYLQSGEAFPELDMDTIIVDALFGTGLNRFLDGLSAQLVTHLNRQPCPIVSIDVPSGLLLDRSSLNQAVIRASHTLSFQATKMAFLLPENAPFTGAVSVLDINLHPAYEAIPPFRMLDLALVRSWYQPRNRFGHKGTYGHALLVGGSYGKMGAMVLATRAALRSGAGLVSNYVPRCGYTILQQSVPEAMCLTDPGDYNIEQPDLDTTRFDAIGIGPGMGTTETTQEAFAGFVMAQTKPLVIDADGLNCLAEQPSLLARLPVNSILTPHPKEFERLFGRMANDFERVEKAQTYARDLRCIIVLKGHHSFIALPNGTAYFNSTGNAGMATGGSGDILTGIITGLLAQGYAPETAAPLGVYLHGLAGDAAAAALSQEALIAGDLAAFLGKAFFRLQS